MIRYASYRHYQALQPGQAVRLGGNGPDWRAWRDARREHADQTIDARVEFLEGFLHGSGLASERVCQGSDLSPFQRPK